MRARFTLLVVIQLQKGIEYYRIETEYGEYYY